MKIYFVIILLIFSSSNLFSQWFPANNGIDYWVGLGTCKMVNENTAYAGGSYGYIYKTTNGASSWYRLDSISDRSFTSLFFLNENTGWAAGNDGVFKTTDGGNNWTRQFTSGAECIHFANENTGMIAPGVGFTMFKTTNGGDNWFALPLIMTLADIRAVFMVDTCVAYAVGEWFNQRPPVLKTTNGGLNWVQQYSGLSLNDYLGAVSFVNRDTGLIGGVTASFRYTSNGGINWLPIWPEPFVSDIEHINEKVVYVAQGSVYIIKSTNGGFNWYTQTTEPGEIYSVSFINENTGIACGSWGALYKTTNGGEPVGITKTGNNIPEKFKLYQNYPNPFNPLTIIDYAIPKKTNVTLEVYDILGRLVKTLVNEFKKPGVYSIQFDGTNLSSGIYFYTIVAGDYRASKKMIIVK